MLPRNDGSEMCARAARIPSVRSDRVETNQRRLTTARKEAGAPATRRPPATKLGEAPD